jgi:hypothetical protein
MAVRRSHVSAVAGCAVYLAAVVALMWNGGDTEPSGGLLSALAMIVWLLGSVLVGRQFGVPALWLPILASPRTRGATTTRRCASTTGESSSS